MIRNLFLSGILACIPLTAIAEELALPVGSQQLAVRVSPLDSYELPVGPFHDGGVPTRRFEGLVERQTWRLDGQDITTLQVLVPLRDQVIAEGYDLVFECEDRNCGGFDFRFGTEVIPAPDMHVDVQNYRFVAAVREPDNAISLLVSRSRNAVYVQIFRVGPTDTAELSVASNGAIASPITPIDERDYADALMKQGHVILSDLVFVTGADVLGDGSHASLKALADFLKDNPDQRIAIVGHTDSVGSLSTNIALSKRRAAAVRNRLLSKYGLTANRIDAEGMGYLSPIASNLTAQGREANRRVEAILLSP